MHGRLQAFEMFVSQARKRRMDRADEQIAAAPFQLQHFHVAESLRDHRIAGIKVSELHDARPRRA